MQVLDFNALDLELKDKVAAQPGGERVTNCYLCGTCTAGCPISSVRGEYNPRKIMRMLLLGMKEEILASPELWQCTQCHVCVAHCPQDVRFADIMRVLRRLAVEQGYVKQELLAAVDQLDLDLRQQRIAKISKLTSK